MQISLIIYMFFDMAPGLLDVSKRPGAKVLVRMSQLFCTFLKSGSGFLAHLVFERQFRKNEWNREWSRGVLPNKRPGAIRCLS